MSILEDLQRNQPVNITSIQGTSDDGSGSQAAVRVRADIVDGMAEVQSMKKTMILSTAQILRTTLRQDCLTSTVTVMSYV